jgi:hypothetical protein
MFYYAHHSDTDIPQYVHPYVLSNVPSMYTLMYIQANYLNVLLYITTIWTLLSMYKSMYLLSVYKSIYFQMFQFLESFFYTHHNDDDAPQYVHIAVPSG